MPLCLEEVDGHQMWLLVCDQCTVEGDHLETIREVREDEAWHLSDEVPDSELEQIAVLCDVCFQSDGSLNYEIRDALIDHLRHMPGGMELDFGRETRLGAIIDALAMGGPQEALEDRLVYVGALGEELGVRTAREALQQVLESVQPPPLSTALPRVEQQGDKTTTVFLNLDSCELPEWVYAGAWVRRLSDKVEGLVNVIEDLNVVLSLEGEHVYWRRAKTAKFDEEFEPLPKPMSRYERLMGEDIICPAAAVGW